MKPLSHKIKIQDNNQAYYQVYDRVHDQIGLQVRNQLWYIIKDQLWHRLYYPVSYKIKNQIKIEL